MLNLKDIDKNAMSQPVVEFLSTLELKHAKNPDTYDVTAVQNINKLDYWQLRFYDPRFSEEEMPPVMVAEWTYGTRSDKEYKVASRKIANARYGHWAGANCARRTKDVKKAVKIALDGLALYGWHEVIAEDKRNAEDKHRGWANENSSATYPFHMGYDVIYEEIKHLVAQGVVFKTEAFKKAAGGIEAVDDYLLRGSKDAKFNTIMQRGETFIFIKDGCALNPQEFNTIDALPENTRNAMALLKLVGGNSLLPEVGYRAGENTYFVYV
jgi:hypothetical protein